MGWNMGTRKGCPDPEDKTRLRGILLKPFRAVLSPLSEEASSRSRPIRPISLCIATLIILTPILGVISVAVPLGSVQATPGSGTSLENFGRARLDPFRIDQMPDFLIQSKSEKEVSIEKVTISPGGHTGWHTHPGPILAIVTEGQIKHTRFTEKNGCIERVFGPGESEQAFVEVPNQVHMARNEGDVDAVLYITRFNIPIRGEITDSSPEDPGC
jgi:quercetin dioxygenase-like cupin family protein